MKNRKKANEIKSYYCRNVRAKIKGKEEKWSENAGFFASSVLATQPCRLICVSWRVLL